MGAQTPAHNADTRAVTDAVRAWANELDGAGRCNVEVWLMLEDLSEDVAEVVLRASRYDQMSTVLADMLRCIEVDPHERVGCWEDEIRAALGCDGDDRG